MSREVFIRWKPHAATLVVVERANSIIEEYQAQGFALTLRQLFYQFVSRGQLENRFNEYKRLGIIVRNARDGGMIDWDAIEDRTREVNTHSFWNNPAEDDTVIEATRVWFRALEPHTGGYYSNIEYERPNAEAGSYGPAYRRLQKVNAQYDPRNLFRLNNNVQPAA